jgi:hypothetical protein
MQNLYASGADVGWHRASFRLYWRLISRMRKPVVRKRLSKEIRELIFKMVAESATWGRHAFMANSSCSASMFPRCAVPQEIQNRPSGG